jgi:hypothetical protein
MGIEFKTENQRNPVQQSDPCAEMKAEFEMMNNFLEDNGYAIIYENYKLAVKLREEMTRNEVENNGFEEIQ